MARILWIFLRLTLQSQRCLCSDWPVVILTPVLRLRPKVRRVEKKLTNKPQVCIKKDTPNIEQYTYEYMDDKSDLYRSAMQLHYRKNQELRIRTWISDKELSLMEFISNIAFSVICRKAKFSIE